MMNTTPKELRFISLNVNGLGNPVKRAKVMRKLKKEGLQICFLQETHLSKIEHEKLKRFGFRKTYYNSYSNTRQRGVAILISNSLTFECIKEIKDKEGRYIIVKGRIEQTTVTLVNVYAPPEADRECFKSLFDTIALETEGICIAGGDYNAILNYGLDTTSKKRSKTHISKLINNTIEEMGFFDVWRDLHPLEKDYSHYSATHSVYSRIDYFFMQKEDRDRVKKCEIGVTDVSDHSALYLTICLQVRRRDTLWRLNIGILNNEAIINQIQTEIENYLQDNDNGETDPIMLWDALKAVLRGKLIAITSSLKKARMAYYQYLLTELKTTEISHKLQPNDENQQKLKETRNKIGELLQQEVEAKARYLKQSYYEVGPKAAKLLARKLRKQQAERVIHKIKDPISNQLKYESKEIEKVFRNYYVDLYSQKRAINEKEIKAFLDKLDLPCIGESQNRTLVSEITTDEITNAIGHLKTSKSPGSDGFPAEWYKKFKKVLSPVLLTTFNWILQENCIPPSWKEAIITVLPKAQKNTELCENYRPISILNIDYKLYTSILAQRLQTFVPDIIDEDQTGFVRGRQTQDNIRRTLLIINRINKYKSPLALISLDAMKAFDLVIWDFLYMTLEKFGFKKKSIQCIKAIYNEPSARIKINGSLSSKFTLERGTRQGCCLSPTLFAIYIEPLAQMIREDVLLSGVEINHKKHVISLFADDVLIYLKDPVSHFGRLLQILERFGDCSGYRLNMSKTQTLLFHTTPSPELKEHKLNWEANSIKYLGVNITKNPSELYKNNYDEVNNMIRSDMERWSTYPMDLTDRINVVKMNIQPRLLYLYQSLPIQVPQTQFTKWDKLISRFIWEGKRPRVRFTTLQLPKSRGGLALPNLREYFTAAQIRPLLNWCCTNFVAHWKDIETNSYTCPIQTFIGERTLPLQVRQEMDPITSFTLDTWHSVVKRLKFDDGLGLLKWIAHDRKFTPGSIDTTYKYWVDKGITAMCTITKEGNMISFQEMKDVFGLANADLFRYLQVRDYYLKEIKKDEVHPLINIFVTSYQRFTPKAISKLYLCILGSGKHSTIYVKSKWEKEIEEEILDETWFDMWRNHQTTTQSHKWREFAWKNQIRFFITPQITSKQTSQQLQCWRKCGEMAPHHTHIFWSCKTLEPFWRQVHEVLCGVLGYNVPFTCKILYLGHLEESVSFEDQYLVKILLIASKKSITKNWLKPDTPSKGQWVSIIKEIQGMEKMTYKLKLKEELYERNWVKWIHYTEM